MSVTTVVPFESEPTTIPVEPIKSLQPVENTTPPPMRDSEEHLNPLKQLVPKVQGLMNEGVKPTQIQKQLATKYGTREIQQIMIDALHPKIDELRDKGVSDEQITRVLQQQGIIPMADKADPSVLPEKLSQPEVPANLVQPEAPIDKLDTQAPLPKIDVENDDPEELLRKMRIITTSAERDFKGLGGMLGASGWANEAGQMQEQADALIANELRRRGINVVSIDAYGDMTIIDPETGQEVEYTSPWYKDLWHGIEGAKFEIGGAITGAAAGGRAGLAIGGGYGALGGALLGGMGGASLGRGADVINAAREMKYQLTLAELQNHMGDAASADGLAALGVAGLWQLGKGTVKGIANGYDRLLRGNRHGAYKALQASTDMSDRQIISMLDRWEKISGSKVLSKAARETGKLSFQEQETAIRVAGQTVEGLEGGIQQAIDMSKTGGAKLAQDIAGRAKDLNKMADAVTNERLTSTVTDHLSSYVDMTKAYYGDVKSLGIDLLKDTDYRYDFSKMLPFEESLGKSADKITNWSLRQDFNSYIQQIRRLGGKEAIQTIQQQADAFAKAKGLKNVQPKITPELVEQYNPNRSFEDLLELRRVVNELRADTRFKSFVNYEAMTKAINSIDGEIARASRQMPNGDYWLRNWKEANEEYSKMKDLSSNVLYKALTKPQINHDKAVKAFADSLAYEGPESFMQVMARLPDKTKRSVEGSVFKHYVGKNTVELSDELSAVNFPKLARDLDKLGFTTPEVRDMKRVVKELSEVFKNDVALAQVAWDSPAGRFRSNIATTVTGKVKMQLATHLFKIWQAIVPTRGSDRLALTLQMRKVLDNPLDSKSINTLLKELPKDPQLDSLVKQRAIEYAKFGKPESYGKTQVWRVAAPGNYDKASDTAMGRGVLFYVDEQKAREIAKQTGAKVTSSNVTTRRLATKADVETLLGRPVEPAELRSREILDALREKDFAGFTVDDKVLMFK